MRQFLVMEAAPTQMRLHATRKNLAPSALAHEPSTYVSPWNGAQLCFLLSSLQSALPQASRNCGIQTTCKKANSLRIRTSKKIRGESLIVNQTPDEEICPACPEPAYAVCLRKRGGQGWGTRPIAMGDDYWGRASGDHRAMRRMRSGAPRLFSHLLSWLCGVQRRHGSQTLYRAGACKFFSFRRANCP